jgi:hypothetical protein
MRFSRLSIALFTSLALACGGAVDTGLLDGGGDGGSQSDATSSDGATNKDSGNKNDASPPTCDDLINELASQQTAAEQCCSTCDSLQCTEQVDGLCCPLSVDDENSDAVKAYEATLAQVKELKCAINCPAIACTQHPTGVCNQSGTCAQ